VVHCDERVCLSVCPYAYIRNHTSDLHQIYSSYYLWLTPLLPTLRHVMYFRFCGWRHACICNVTRLASDSPGETPNRGRSVISTIAMSDACFFYQHVMDNVNWFFCAKLVGATLNEASVTNRKKEELIKFATKSHVCWTVVSELLSEFVSNIVEFCCAAVCSFYSFCVLCCFLLFVLV